MDFLVEFQPLEQCIHSGNYFGLLNALKTTFNRQIDLVETDAIRNPYFIEAVNKTRELHYMRREIKKYLWGAQQACDAIL